MGGRSETTDRIIGLVSRRSDVLRTLRRQPCRKCQLADVLEVSRSTVDRAVRELERHELVERNGHTYEPTTAGTLALVEYDRLTDRLRGITASQPALSELSSDAPLDGAAFEDATVVLSKRTDPNAPARELRDLIGASETHLAAVPGVLPEFVEQHRRRIVEDGMTARFLLRDCVVERVLSDHRSALQSALDTGRLEVRTTDSAFDHSLIVSRNDERTVAAIAVYVESGIRGLVHSEADAAVEWAEREFERRWERASPLALDAPRERQHPR